MATTEARVTGDMEGLTRLLADRWSCRGFLPEPVSRETVTQVLDLARRWPSWCNTQPWQVLITEGDGTERFRAALAAYAPFIREHFGLPENRLVVCGMSFGWPDHDHRANGFRTRRVTIEETATWVS